MSKPQKSLESKMEYRLTSFEASTLIEDITTESSFDTCKFTDIDFSSKKLSNCRFEKCTFERCNLNVVKLFKCKMLDVHFVGSRLTGIDWSQMDTAMGFSIDCKDSELSYSLFSGSRLQKSTFLNCKIHEAEFSSISLKEVNFEGSDLLNTKFISCDMTGANFEKAVNYVFDLRDNKCKKARFSRPEVENLFIPFELKIS